MVHMHLEGRHDLMVAQSPDQFLLHQTIWLEHDREADEIGIMTYLSKKVMKKFDKLCLELKVRKPMLRISRECKIILLSDDECPQLRT